MVGAMIHSCNTLGCDTDGSTGNDLTIYAYGDNAMDGVNIECYEGSKCYLHCFGNACSSIGINNGWGGIVCHVGAICKCDGPDCPYVPTGGPTAEPIENLEEYAFQDIEVNVAQHSFFEFANELNGSMLLVGAGTAMFMLVVMFYFIGGSKKGEYEPLE